MRAPARRTRDKGRFHCVMLLTGVLTSCTSLPSPTERRAHADALASANGWQATRVSAAPFTLAAWVPRQFEKQQHLSVYVEGDGFAWISTSTPSSDPTPREPLALQLALAHPDGNAVYLGRPCQYLDIVDPIEQGQHPDVRQQQCPQRYWTGARFAPEVITSTSNAIDTLKQQFGATRVTLIGYSGGGAVAALLAARRHDVDQLITVAGNLDTTAWTHFHRLDPLVGSLNPVDDADRLTNVRQTHFVGTNDSVIPPVLVDQWPKALLGKNKANVRKIEGYTHTCCWAERWAELYRLEQPHCAVKSRQTACKPRK